MGAVLLRKSIKYSGNIVFIHAYSCIPDTETKGGLVLILSSPLHTQSNAATRIRKLDRITQDVDEYLLDLHVVTNVVIIYGTQDAALILKSFILALAHNHRINLLQHGGEGENLSAQYHTPGFNTAHIQNVIDEREQMSCAVASL